MKRIPNKVIKTQTLKDGTIYRRRKTKDATLIFTTYEIPTLANIIVAKKNATTEYFDHYKLFGTIYVSFKMKKVKVRNMQSNEVNKCCKR